MHIVFMTATEPIKLKIDDLDEKGKRLVLEVCAKNNCSPDEAIKIIMNKLTEKGAK